MRDRQVIRLEQLGRQRRSSFSLVVEVELVDEQDVGPGALDDLGHRVRLVIAGGRKVDDELAFAQAVEGGVEGREPHRTGGSPDRMGWHRSSKEEDAQAQRGQRHHPYFGLVSRARPPRFAPAPVEDTAGTKQSTKPFL